MTSAEDVFNTLQDVINELADDQTRYEVLRTRYDEERQPIQFRRTVLKRDNYRCVICGKGGRLEIDHIIPWSAGGSDDIDNLRTLCHDCNQRRSNIKLPFDAVNRRMPNGYRCVNCTPDLIGAFGITAIYCMSCSRKAPGVPFTEER